MISVIVVSYNTSEMTLACLRSVFEQTKRVPFELIVVDNASTDGSADAIEEEFADRVRLIRSQDNLGFAGGNNLAAREAAGDRLLLLNPDTLILDGAIDAISDFADANAKARIWGARTLFADDSLNPMSAWKRMTLWGLACRAAGLTNIFPRSSLFNPEAMGGWDRTTDRDVDIVSGCYFLIDTDLWRELDGFDPAFFMYGEEADLCLRAHAKGARPRAAGEIAIVHYGGASETVRADKMVRLLTAKRLLINRHFAPTARPLGRLLHSAWPFSRALAHGVLCRLGRKASREPAQVWGEIWKRRREWAR